MCGLASLIRVLGSVREISHVQSVAVVSLLAFTTLPVAKRHS